MPFKPGRSGNPGGRKKALGLSRAVRKSCGLRAWKILLDIMEERIREEQIVFKDGEPITVDVVPSVKERREACKLIISYCWGTPDKADFDGKQGELERRVEELEDRLKVVTGETYYGNGLRAAH